MTAIILAAGYGRRMRPLSDFTHKALLRVGNSTILGRIVEGLLSIQVTDIVVVSTTAFSIPIGTSCRRRIWRNSPA